MDQPNLPETTDLAPEINKSLLDITNNFIGEETTNQIPETNSTSLYDASYYYDLTAMNYPLDLKSVPIWEMTIKITIYVLIILLAIAGNMLIIVVVARNKRMQSTTNFFIVNLAISDLLVTGCCTWVRLVDDLTEGWILGDFFCKVNSFAQGEQNTYN